MTASGPDHLPRAGIDCDEQAIAELYDQYGKRLFRTAMAILGRSADAEDAVQEVFVSLVRVRQRLDGVDDLAGYLFAALRNAAIQIQRKQRRRSETNAQMGLEHWSSPPGEKIPESEVREELFWAMSQLPHEQREVVAYRLAGELSLAKIAEITETKVQTVASRYRYAIEKLRLLLQKHE